MKDTITKGIRHGLIGGAIASLCCMGPYVLTLIGIGFFFGITGTCMPQLRLPFILVGLLFIIFAGTRHFRNQKTCTLSHRCIYSAAALVASSAIYIIFLWIILPLIRGPAICT